MKLVRKGKTSYLQPAALCAGLTAGFSTRNGGVSRPPYHSLNLGTNTDDIKAHVEGNRSTFVRAFDLPLHQLLTVKQVHGKDLLLVDEPNLDLSHFARVEVDAIVTNQPGIMIGILTADCYPVLLWNRQLTAIAAIHIGWRSAAGGLIHKTIKTMTTHFNCAPEDLVAAIGPGIGADKYEVDRPVRDAFRQGSGFWNEISSETRLGHWHLNLARSCRLQLEQAGLTPDAIEEAGHCTFAQAEMFFSYRRDDGKTGRQIGFIMLNNSAA
ncbi:MAG: peptidoglycan editing factor PgeF [Desulfuromonadales bacterium]|nr:peptidoglycan editing factor PgeF [Desulfuromonadales bacterium]